MLLKILKKIIRFILIPICTSLWNFAEYFNINLGRFAPYIFNGMIGCYKMKLVKKYVVEKSVKLRRVK
jgi:hypothetical protein